MSKRILFIHHGGIAGGAPLSMLYTMQGARQAGYEPIAALRKSMPELHNLYNSAGFRTIEVPWIPFFITWSGSEGKWWNPVTWKGVYDAFKVWRTAKKKLQDLIKDEEIDLVHLNSVGLSNPAEALMEADLPFVWHIREHGPVRKGKRYKYISTNLAKARNIIFLSNAEQMSWLGESNHGIVIHNFIDFKKFDATKSTRQAKHDLNIPGETKVILYVGGSKLHKGVLELLEVLGELKKVYGENFICLMPDSAVRNPRELNKVELKMEELIHQGSIAPQCKLLPFNPDIVNLFAACDVLVFPATKPHFARPIVEASGMGKPVLASNLKAIDELVKHGETGYLIDVDSRKAWLNRIIELFNDEELAKRMGEAGRIFASEEFEYEKQMKKIIRLYQKALSD